MNTADVSEPKMSVIPTVLPAQADDPALYELEKGEWDYKTKELEADDQQKHQDEVKKCLRRMANDATYCNRQQKEQLFEVLTKHSEAFATDQRFCQMNKLTPI